MTLVGGIQFRKRANRCGSKIAMLFLSLSCSLASHATEQPNIVIMLADDLTWSDVYDAQHLDTPNIDRLAQQGVRFNNMFTATAMCAPTRQQLYSGLFPVRSGAFPNHGVVDEGTRSMVHMLTELGYRVGLSGKTHIGPESSFPFEIIGRNPAEDGGPNDVDLPAFEKFALRDDEEPFAAVLAFNEPHEPWTKGDPDKFDLETIHVPRYLVGTEETKKALAKYYAEIEYLDGEIGRVLQLLSKHNQAENTLVIFTSEQGAAFPFAKWSLYDAGLKTAFIVRWPKRLVGGRTLNALVQYVDVVPTLVEAAGGHSSEALDGRSFLSLLLNAKLNKQEKDHHRDVVFGVHTNRGIIHGVGYPIRSIRDERFKLIWNLESTQVYRNIRTEVKARDVGFSSWFDTPAGETRARFYQHRPEFEMYDLSRDPDELKNVAGEPEYISHRARLMNALQNWMRDQADLDLATEQTAIEHMDPTILKRIQQRYGKQALPDG